MPFLFCGCTGDLSRRVLSLEEFLGQTRSEFKKDLEDSREDMRRELKIVEAENRALRNQISQLREEIGMLMREFVTPERLAMTDILADLKDTPKQKLTRIINQIFKPRLGLTPKQASEIEKTIHDEYDRVQKHEERIWMPIINKLREEGQEPREAEVIKRIMDSRRKLMTTLRAETRKELFRILNDPVKVQEFEQLRDMLFPPDLPPVIPGTEK